MRKAGMSDLRGSRTANDPVEMEISMTKRTPLHKRVAHPQRSWTRKGPSSRNYRNPNCDKHPNPYKIPNPGRHPGIQYVDRPRRPLRAASLSGMASLSSATFRGVGRRSASAQGNCSMATERLAQRFLPRAWSVLATLMCL